ncbi:MAG TPA: phage Gp37/Gp68 family protein, partial [Thermoanaerobaculia bacterium]|nr:phage Gp37/Gp68 family protein [Thermoanaerobaculia bacterium]
GVAGHPYEQGFDLRLVPGKLDDPLRWLTPKRIFVNSMSDLFHDDVPDEYIVRVAKVMLRAHWHVFQILTKRSERMRDALNTYLREAAEAEHIWWGVSVEDRKFGLPRIVDLQRSDARVRFLSVEPLLEDLGDMDLSGISWVIVGGESGPGARSMHPTWVDNVFRQCRAQRVSFFFKQWGGTRKKSAGRMLHGRTYDEMPAGVAAG